MRIVQIDAVRFGTLSIDSPVKLKDGLNLWVSRNQAGKTTLLTFLEWMLYGPPPAGPKGQSRGAKDPAAIRRWTPWSGGQPSGRIVIQPELKDWPGEVLVSARFGDYFIQLSEYRTQRTLPDSVVVSKLGEWNLGQQLLNLSRESFQQSLVAYQGQLAELLQRGNLRQVLASDLGSLVVNPDIALADRVIATLDNPVFVLAGSEARTLRDHEMALTKELDILELERRGLEQRLGEFRDVLGHRDTLTAQLEQQERMLNGLDRQARQLELARSYYLLHASQPAPAAPEVAQLAQEQAALPPVSADLERDVDRLAGQLEATEQQLARARGELVRVEAGRVAETARLQSSAKTAGLLQAGQQLREAAGKVEAAHDDYQRALQKSGDLEAKIPPRLRNRHAELERLFEPQRANLAAIAEWQKETTAINDRLVKLRERRAELQILSRMKLPASFYIGVALIVIGMLQLFAGGLFGPFNFIPWLILLALLAIAAVLTSPYWRARRSTGPAAAELRAKVNPEIEQQIGQLTAQDRKRRRFLELYEIERPAWDKLVDNIQEFMQLDQQMRELQAAGRERETVKRRLDAAWLDIGAVLPLAPLSVDMDWLAQQLLAQTQPGGDAANLAALEARCAQLKREEQQLAEQVEALTRAMSDKLEPLGLGGQVKAGLRSALDAFRSLADRARLASQTKDRQALLADSLRGMVMDESEFNQQWSELPEADQVRVMQLASTREGFETACARLPEVSRARKEAETQRESLRKAMDGVRDQLETFGRIDREAEQMQRGTEDARVRQQLVERWDKALKITSRLVDSMVNRAAQNIAPEIERALRQVLEQAPIKGLQDVRLGKNLDLEITYENAPAGLPAEELLDYLSAGALQQLALALRLALARVASGRTDLPLLLDEPLAELDDERAQLAFRYIARLAESTQIVITTCHERQYSWLVQETGMASLLRVPVKP